MLLQVHEYKKIVKITHDQQKYYIKLKLDNHSMKRSCS